MRAVGGEDGGGMRRERESRVEAVELKRASVSLGSLAQLCTGPIIPLASHPLYIYIYSNLHGSWHRQRGRVPDLLCSMLCMCDNNSRHKLRF